ncbi:MAG: 4-hydroxy-tetrahydrodipicolinate synthase [Clostridiales bacterium]|jgi:4-hydroxy-tetrahydrodipicolinate synthase|nr:4-hydroxy-tetrahydrodipicolinate synthase [Clostridiales bacterium]
MKKPVFVGSAVALITPFNEGGVDTKKLKALIDFHLAHKTDAILVAATTGEAATMPDEEHLATIRTVVEYVDGRVPVIAGTGSNDTAHGIKLTREATAIGADALLTVTPYYNKTSQEGIYRHFKATAEATHLPIILYNVPSRTNLNIAPATYKRLSEIENIVGVKECNMNQIPETVNLCGDDLLLYSGEDGLVVPLLSMGGKGVISVAAHVIPETMHDMVMAFINGDVQGAAKMQADIIPLVKALFSDVNPIPVKEALNILGWDIGSCRMPLCDMSEEGKAKLAETLKKYDLSFHPKG